MPCSSKRKRHAAPMARVSRLMLGVGLTAALLPMAGWAQTPVIPPAITESAPVRVEVQRVQASGGAASLPGFVDVGSPRRGFAN